MTRFGVLVVCCGCSGGAFDAEERGEADAGPVPAMPGSAAQARGGSFGGAAGAGGTGGEAVPADAGVPAELPVTLDSRSDEPGPGAYVWGWAPCLELEPSGEPRHPVTCGDVCEQAGGWTCRAEGEPPAMMFWSATDATTSLEACQAWVSEPGTTLADVTANDAGCDWDFIEVVEAEGDPISVACSCGTLIPE